MWGSVTDELSENNHALRHLLRRVKAAADDMFPTRAGVSDSDIEAKRAARVRCACGWKGTVADTREGECPRNRHDLRFDERAK